MNQQGAEALAERVSEKVPMKSTTATPRVRTPLDQRPGTVLMIAPQRVLAKSHSAKLGKSWDLQRDRFVRAASRSTSDRTSGFQAAHCAVCIRRFVGSTKT